MVHRTIRSVLFFHGHGLLREHEGIFVGLVSSNINNLSPQSLTPPLIPLFIMKETIIPVLYMDRVITYRTEDSFVVKFWPRASCVAQQM